MIPFLARRILDSLATLAILATATFFLMRLAPGGPFDAEQAWPPEIQANILHRYELDQPVPVQFVHWMEDLIQGDMRDSFQYTGRPVTEIIRESLPVSLTLGLSALALAVALGVPLGALAAARRGTWWDWSAMFVAITGISLPTYLVASVLILVFSLWLGWLPPALWEGPSSAVLPVLTLAARPLAIVARMTRASLLDAIGADYVRTAHGKGLSPRAVILRHALRNSVVPVVTLLGPIAAGLATGSFLVEVVFQIPGLGKHFVGAVLNRDYPLVMGVTLTYAGILLTSNLLVDLSYGFLDPRIRLQ